METNYEKGRALETKPLSVTKYSFNFNYLEQLWMISHWRNNKKTEPIKGMLILYACK